MILFTFLLCYKMIPDVYRNIFGRWMQITCLCGRSSHLQSRDAGHEPIASVLPLTYTMYAINEFSLNPFSIHNNAKLVYCCTAWRAA